MRSRTERQKSYQRRCALHVFAMDRKIRGWLERNDPKALAQAEAAIAEENEMEKFVEGHGNRCPWCASPHLGRGANMSATSDEIRAEIECEGCKRRWVAIYSLSAAECQG